MDYGEIPPEIANTPTQLVFLVNLDIKNNSAHKNVYDAFINNRRSDRLPLNFIVASSTHEFPKPKRKNAPYESASSSSKFILKYNWFQKHLAIVPAVVVLFVDLDWDHPSWNEKKLECSGKVESLRHSLQGRNTRICVVLVQNSPPLPPDSMSAQRATDLCSQCDLSPKSLFVLPRTDHLFGYILRLEHAFYELAQSYYQSEIKSVKQIKDSVAKTSFSNLLVRYQFKLAFLNDLRQDTHSALRHYKQSYQHLLDYKMDETNILEAKIIAGFLNYKITKICFQHNTPLDAISHFRKHIDFFKDRPTISGLEFEHYAWMAKQFGLFGDLFDLAVQNGLAAIQTQHPGFYYQSAAEQAIIRKNVGQKLLSATSTTTIDPGNFDYIENFVPEHFGQRPWSTSATLGILGGDQSDQKNRETSSIFYLQWREANRVDHSSTILHYLGAASNHFKKYRCPRMRLLIMVRTGEQYISMGEFDKALQVLSHAVYEYRMEKWWPLLKVTSLMALKCAYAVANLKAYTSLSLELCSRTLNVDDSEKRRVQQNFLRVLNGQCPDPEPDASVNVIERARVAWTSLLNDRCFFLVPMHSIYGCVDIRVNFDSNEIQADEIVKLIVRFRLSCPLPMKFSKLSVQFTNNSYDQYCTIVDDGLYFQPNDVREFGFSFVPSIDDVGREIKVSSVVLDVGNLRSNIYGNLQWENFDRDGAYPIPFEYSSPSKRDIFSTVRSNPVVKIACRSSKIRIDVEHNPPVLVGELYKLSVAVTNQETAQIRNAKLRTFLEPVEGSLEFPAEILLNPRSSERLNEAEFEFGVLNAEATNFVDVYVRCRQIVSSLKLLFQVTYDVEATTEFGSILCKCVGNESFSINVISPFAVHSKILSLKGDFIDRLVFDEKSLLVVEIKCVCPSPVVVDSIDWRLDPCLLRESAPSDVDVYRKIDLNCDECASFVCVIRPIEASQNLISLGNLAIKWNRLDNDDAELVETLYSCLSSPIENCPVIVDVKLPAYGCVRHPFIAVYELKNLTSNVLELQILVDSSECFMFSGHKQILIRLLPYDKNELLHVLLPLVAGQVLLPRLKLTSSSYAQEIFDRFAQRNVPISMFILPYGKTKPHVTNRELSLDGGAPEISS